MMNKYILILLIFCLNVNANTLEIHKRIIPISLLQIKNIVNKNEKTIHLLIVTKGNQMAQALKLKELLPKRVKSFSIIITIIKNKYLQKYTLEDKNTIDAMYCFDLSSKQYEFINKLKNKIPTFSYDLQGLKKGALIYIQLKNKIHILMNRQTMQDTKINFNNQFLQMVELYD